MSYHCFLMPKFRRFTYKWYVCQILKKRLNSTMNSNTCRTIWPFLNDIYLNCKIHATCMLRSWSFRHSFFLLQTYFAEGGQEKANQTKFLACRQYNSKVIFLTLLTLKFTYHMSPPIFYNDISADFKWWVKEIA